MNNYKISFKTDDIYKTFIKFIEKLVT
jgi:hypothetical protein